MLKTRVATAVVLLAVLLLVLFSNSFVFFALVAAAFFAAAAWESFRLFGNKHPVIGAAMWTAAFAFLLFKGDLAGATVLFGLCVAIWAVRLAPSLAIGLPPPEGFGNRLLNGIYDTRLFPRDCGAVHAFSAVSDIRDGDRLGCRYRRLLCRQGIWKTQACAIDFAGQVMGGRHRRLAGGIDPHGCHHRIASPERYIRACNSRKMGMDRIARRDDLAGHRQYSG
jgi:hypothetical protein